MCKKKQHISSGNEQWKENVFDKETTNSALLVPRQHLLFVIYRSSFIGAFYQRKDCEAFLPIKCSFTREVALKIVVKLTFSNPVKLLYDLFGLFHFRVIAYDPPHKVPLKHINVCWCV